MEVVRGEASLDDVIVCDAKSGVHFLPLAESKLTAADVFGGEGMDRLLSELRNRYDFIILDTAPLLALADARILAAKTDAVVLLCRWRKTPQDAVRSALRLLQTSGAPIAGVALTRVDVRKQPAHGYGDSTYYYRETQGVLRRLVRETPPAGFPMRVAIVHYWLVAMRGGERVLERVLKMFPEADLFTHVYDPDAVSDEIRRRKVTTTFIDRLPASKRLYQKYLPLMPMALEGLDLRGYDLVLSFEAGPAKGVIAPPDALHVCYCHSPMRYLWDAYGEYRQAAGPLARASMPWLFPPLRLWDHASASRVDGLIANSTFIQRRIKRAWGRDSVVVHPPVPVDAFEPADAVGESYLWVGQMTPYKRADLAVAAANALGRPLLVVGDGEMRKEVEKQAGATIRFARRLSFKELCSAYARARALIFTAEEDFGIVPVEVQAAGRPVLAYKRGGVLDSVLPGKTGIFFAEQSVEGAVAGLRDLEDWLPTFNPC